MRGEVRGRLIRDGLLAAFVVCGAVYLVWRPSAFNTEAPVFSTIFWVAEILAYLAALVRLTVTRRADMGPPRPPPAPEAWPSIDVFVTAYTEPAAMLRRTLLACRAMEGAHRTWLLDDGDRPELSALAAELGCDYLARADNTGAKAGNLNHGLAHSTGEFIAVFDADHMPEPGFLRRLVGYFRDPELALVQTPQDYFNLDSFQHGKPARRRNIWHEQSVFHWTEQPGRAALDAATCCGCSMMLRRAAIADIGGFPEETVTEDMHASIRLHKRGWTSVFHAEPLAFGVAPASPREFLRQRLRWGEGNMQVSRIEGVPFSRDLTLGQNLAYLMLGTTYLEAWIKLVAYIAPIVFLFTAVPPIWSDFQTYFAYFLPYLAVGLLAHVEFGRGYAPLLWMERFAMARLTAGLAATTGFFRRHIRFRVTDKTTGGTDGLLLLAPQAAVLVFGVAGLAYAAWRQVDINQPPPPLWITVAVGSLALYNAVLATWVLVGAVRTALLPRGDWLCPEPLPVLFAGEAAPRFVRGLAADRAVLGEAAPGAGKVRIFLPQGDLDLTGTGDGRTFHLTASRRETDFIEAGLYIGRWRRLLSGQEERRPTWLELLRILPAPPRLRPWTIGLLEAAGHWRLAALQDERLLLFGSLAAPAGGRLHLPQGPREVSLDLAILDAGLAGPTGGLGRLYQLGAAAPARAATSVTSASRRA